MMKHRATGGHVWLAVFAASTCVLTMAGRAAAAAEQTSGRKPNVLLIVTDDQRPDTIRELGNRAIHTPHLDSLVREGMTFTRAIARRMSSWAMTGLELVSSETSWAPSGPPNVTDSKEFLAGFPSTVIV